MLPFSAPRALTSLTSAAYRALVSDNGPAVRNRDARPIANGLTLATHAKGSLAMAGTSGRQSPAPVPAVKVNVPNRPSLARLASIAAATAAPILMPALLREPFGIVASDVA